jgi:hypothetical protein
MKETIERLPGLVENLLIILRNCADLLGLAE